jgi:site-specific recombinase XerD
LTYSPYTYIQKYVIQQNIPYGSFIFKSRRGKHITRSGVAQRITAITQRASDDCYPLNEKNITPHTFRHSTAMNLLRAGVDISTIAIWLGHESIETTHKYMVADLEIKHKAMEKLDETTDDSFNYKPSKTIISFLKSL